MHDGPDFIDFPDLPDEAVIALNDFLEQLYAAFQNHYFAQMHRHYHDDAASARDADQTSPPLDDPPF